MSNDFERRLETAIDRLPREREPAVDLWPGIEAGLDGPGRRWTVPASLAAALAAGLALTVWLAAPVPGPATSPSQATAGRVSPVAAQHESYLLREAALVDQSYRAAMLAGPGTDERARATGPGRGAQGPGRGPGPHPRGHAVTTPGAVPGFPSGADPRPAPRLGSTPGRRAGNSWR